MMRTRKWLFGVGLALGALGALGLLGLLGLLAIVLVRLIPSDEALRLRATAEMEAPFCRSFHCTTWVANSRQKR
ncbi:MAG: hypothetical protein ABIR56_06065 [Polaromonas sp.]